MADGSHFVKKIQKNKVAYRSEMARNSIESEFRTSKMANGSHLRIDLNWPQKCDQKSEFQTSQKSAGSHFVKKYKWPPAAILHEIKKKIPY